jgi:hypothetical protein
VAHLCHIVNGGLGSAGRRFERDPPHSRLRRSNAQNPPSSPRNRPWGEGLVAHLWHSVSGIGGTPTQVPVSLAYDQSSPTAAAHAVRTASKASAAVTVSRVCPAS